MSSLKQIMNTDEDSQDPDSHKRSKHAVSTSRESISSSLAPARSSPSASSYATGDTHAFGPLTFPTHTLNSASAAGPSRSPYSFAPEGSSFPSGYTSSAAPASGRRVSNTSTDSMDLPYYHHPPPGAGDGSQKMTPVTKRPSRAKKGMPVHVCEKCPPTRTFTRAEHLRRHQQIHEAPRFACSVPGCDKVFFREDLYKRHCHKHQQDDGSTTESTPPPRRDHSSHSRARYDNLSPRHPILDPHSNPDASLPPASWSPGRPNITSSDPDYPQVSDYTYENVMPSAPPYPTAPPNWFDGVSPGHHDPSMQVPHPYPTMASSQPNDSNVQYNDPLMNASLAEYGTENPLLSAHHAPHATVRSLPISLGAGQSSESLVVLQPVAPPWPVGTSHPMSRPTHETVATLMIPTSLSEEARRSLPTYMDVYWEKVHPSYPVIHRLSVEGKIDERRRTSASDEQNLMRQCAMAALATQFLGDKVHRNHGNELYAYAWHKATENKGSEHMTLETMQAILLCEYYARFRGKRRGSHLPSAQFRELYQNVASHQDLFEPIPTGATVAEAWMKWIHLESRRRVLTACFLLDVHGSRCFKQVPISVPGMDYSSVSTLHIPLSIGLDNLWQATDAHMWNNLARSAPRPKFLSTTLTHPLTAAVLAASPPWDAIILLAGSSLLLRVPQSPMRVPSVSADVAHLASLFRHAAIANAYFAFHHTPMHEVLSVSGDSWLFNEKIMQAHIFRGHRQTLSGWSSSNEATVAAFFAVRSVAQFLGLRQDNAEDVHRAVNEGRPIAWKGISDYWALYVCTLICWAWGRGLKMSRDEQRNEASRKTAIAWLLKATTLDVHELGDWVGRGQTLAVICLIRDILDRGCPSGQNRLFGDAVGVLKDLSGREPAGF